MNTETYKLLVALLLDVSNSVCLSMLCIFDSAMLYCVERYLVKLEV